MSQTTRPDLLALDDTALLTFGNRGLLKRAKKLIARGVLPALDIDRAATLRASFDDGHIATLPVNASIAEATCTCGSTKVCRHRIGAVLALQHGDSKLAAAGEHQDAAGGELPPFAMDDTALEAFVGRAAMRRARRERGAVDAAEVRLDVRPVTVELSLSTVRFFVPWELAHTACDCGIASCEHLILAAWAIAREQSGVTREHAQSHVNTEPLLEALTRIVSEGVRLSSMTVDAQLPPLSSSLRRQGGYWLADGVDELSAAMVAYRSRGAGYDAARFASLLSELVTRVRLARGGTVPAAEAVGAKSAGEVQLDHAALLSLGVSARHLGGALLVNVYFARTDGAGLLVVRKRFEPSDDEEVLSLPGVASRHWLGTSFGRVAGGHVITANATRRPNRRLELRRGAAAKTTVAAQTGDWAERGVSIEDDFAALRARMVAAPPAVARARWLAHGLVVVQIASVDGLRYHAGERRVRAVLKDAQGDTIAVEREYHESAPGALGAMARSLNGDTGKVRYISGFARLRAGLLVLQPLAIVADRLVVLDLAGEEASSAPRAASGGNVVSGSPWHPALDGAREWLARGVHEGLANVRGGWREEARDIAAVCRGVGLEALAVSIDAAGRGAPGAWFSAHERLELTAHAVARQPWS